MVLPRRPVRFSADRALSRPDVLWAVNPQEAKGRLLSSQMRAPLFRPKTVGTKDSLFSDIDEWREEVRPRLPTLILRKTLKAETRNRLAQSRARMQSHLSKTNQVLNFFRDDDQTDTETDLNVDNIWAAPADPAENPAIVRKLRRDLWDGRKLIVLPQRILVHVLNIALIAVAPPVGAALATYSCLRGENLRATTLATVVTGMSFLTVSVTGHGMIYA